MPIIEIQSPDGRTVEIDVPEGATRVQVRNKVEQIKAQMSSQVGQMSTLERGLAGIGQGMVNVGRQVGNIFGMISDEEMEQYRQLDAPLLETTAGKVGSVIGEVASLAPVAGGLVGAAGKAASSAIPALRTAAAARPIRAGAAVGAAEGALEGAVIGGPDNRGLGAGVGAIAGGLTGGILPMIAHGFVKPTAEAKQLMDMGVDLTPGQMDPTTWWNRFEQAATDTMPKMFGEARTSGQRQASEIFLQQARPPGSPEVPTGDMRQMLSDVYDQYKPAYDKLKNIPVDPDVQAQIKVGFKEAAEDLEVLAGDEQRASVAKYLANQASKLTGRAAKAGDLLSVRSSIRKAITKARKNQKWDEAEMLSTAEEFLTEQLNKGMPAKAAEYNRALDSQYSRYKIAEEAVYRMGDTRDFPTPFQWSQAAKSGASKGAYARGAGRMRPEVQANANVFQTTVPQTGARLATLGGGTAFGVGVLGALGGTAGPGVAALAVPPMLGLVGTQAGRRFSGGMSPWQPGLQQLLEQYQMAPAMLRGTAAITYPERE